MSQRKVCLKIKFASSNKNKINKYFTYTINLSLSKGKK